MYKRQLRTKPRTARKGNNQQVNNGTSKVPEEPMAVVYKGQVYTLVTRRKNGERERAAAAERNRTNRQHAVAFNRTTTTTTTVEEEG
jgi:hypothetical protein